MAGHGLLEASWGRFVPLPVGFAWSEGHFPTFFERAPSKRELPPPFAWQATLDAVRPKRRPTKGVSIHLQYGHAKVYGTSWVNSTPSAPQVLGSGFCARVVAYRALTHVPEHGPG